MKARPARPPASSLYVPLDFFVIRAPLLPVEAYRDLSRDSDDASTSESVDTRLRELLAARDDIRRALAVGSATLFEATQSEGSRRAKVESKLLRYIIRMATRPTPFGLFAGVALGRWDERTSLELSTAARRQRTRPDMSWLMRVVLQLEAVPEIRRHLRLAANPAALIRGGRVFLAERVSRAESSTPPGVSIRATGVVRRALSAARQPVPFETLAALLLATTPGATSQKVVALLDELWEQTLLLTNLRPPLTGESPLQYVIDRLEGISAAASMRAKLQAVCEAADAWDASPEANGAERYRTMLTSAATLAPVDRSPFQVDSAVPLAGDTVSHRVRDEVARVAELLLRLSPTPRGPLHLAAYRRQFVQRYGAEREVLLLELLDPNFGLGPPLARGAHLAGAIGTSEAKSWQRNHVLLELAANALRDGVHTVDLDDSMLLRLQTRELPADFPASLDLYASLHAASREALDAGDFQIVVGPNVGGLAAGRTLGRFADLLPGAREALQRAAAAEEALAPHALWAELAYQPRLLRLANVSIRPNVRKHEIALGVSAGCDAAGIVPLDELVVGVRDDRFYVRWPAAGQDVVITASHMLTHVRAPAVCRFLSELSRDGCCQLAGFQWGPAAGFPFLPRVRVGRIVLALAQWRLATGSLPAAVAHDIDAFREGLEQWRARWEVPRHVYLSAGDHRLLLDLSSWSQADELRRTLRRLRNQDALVVTEVFPDLNHAWVQDSDRRHFMTELVVPLARVTRGTVACRPSSGTPEGQPDSVPASRAAGLEVRETRIAQDEGGPVGSTAMAATQAVRSYPPGSEWMFAKLYVGRVFEDDLLAGPVRSLVHRVLASGMAAEWFFVRYNDPERHLRLRFRGRPQSLVRDLLPVLCVWARERMQEGVCRRFVLDTYEREIERFGGVDAMAAVETLFAAESQAVVDLLELQQTKTITLDRMHLAVLTVDALLDGLGLDLEARFRWCRERVRSRREASLEYRQAKQHLRALLGDVERVLLQSGGREIVEITGRIRQSGATLRQTLLDIEMRGNLTRPPRELHDSFVHLHLNRLVGGDRSAESRVLGLLWRVREGLHRSAMR